MKRFQKILRSIGIRQRMQFGFLLLPLLMMLIVLFVYYQMSSDMILEKNAKDLSQSLEIAQAALYHKTSQMEQTMQDLLQEEILYDCLVAQEPMSKEDVKELERKHSALLERNAFSFFDEQKRLLYQDGKYYAEDLHDEEKVHWSFDTEHKQISLSSALKRNGKVLGYICIGYNEDVFHNMFQKEEKNEERLLFLCDEQGNYLLGDDAMRNYNFSSNKDKIKLDNTMYYQKQLKAKDFNWNLVALAQEEYVMKDVQSFRNMLFLNVLVVILVESIFSMMIYKSIYDPTHNLVVSMRKAKESNFRHGFVEDHGNDELHELSENFNELLVKADDLLEKVKSEQEQTRQTQIQLLQAQINPHFLFNTLNTLRYLAILNEDAPVSEGISALSRLLRNTIVDKQEYVSIAEEIHNVQDYIVIQKLRYGDLFETEYIVDKGVEGYRILKFLLQPIVENSILHAFREDGLHQKLTLRIYKKENCLMVVVGDNGKGFSIEKQMEKRSRLSNIGIKNIQERISLMYGKPYDMKIESEEGKGTMVTLCLPLKKGVDEDV